MGTLAWEELKLLLKQQFMPIDAAHWARDQWAQCTQGKGTVWAYIDRFHWVLLHVQDAAPAEVLDRFIHGLAPLFCASACSRPCRL